MTTTTGSTGTVRPKPKTHRTNRNAPPSRSGALLNQAPSRPYKCEDDYDEEMNGSVEYNDDGDESSYNGVRRDMADYDSDTLIDMEDRFE